MYDELLKTNVSIDLSPEALNLLQDRYLIEKDGLIETPKELFARVATNIGAIEKIYEKNNFEDTTKTTTESFFRNLIEQNFIPASPILMHAGTSLQSLFSDYALGVPDSMEAIFDTLKFAARIQQQGGGVGFNFSKIRPQYDSVASTQHVAFGPINVMEIFDTSFSAIMQGGRRPGANMAVLHITHPDIRNFIAIKNDKTKLKNFNLSILITDEFMQAVKDDEEIDLINPRTNEVVDTLVARQLLKDIATSAWSTGDPGVLFIDEMNARYPFSESSVLCTGPCGQYELEHLEAVPYAHINLPKMLSGSQLDEDKLRNTIQIAVRFLDNCIDAHKYLNEDLEKKTKESRKIGLGVLGFANLLKVMNINYGSSEAIALVEIIMSIVKEESRAASHQLAKDRGTFPSFDETNWEKEMRNAAITSIAPTGSTSIIANTSASIEPLFEEAVQISAKDHLKVLAAFQKHIDNSISKTISLPNHASVDEVVEIFITAWELKCKSITVYRDGSRDDQVVMYKKS